MGYHLTVPKANDVFKQWSEENVIYAPKRFVGGGAFSDTDIIRYGEVEKIEEIEFNEKSDFSFKEILIPLSETLFFFTEDEVKEANQPKKGAIVLLRSCDLHAVKRLDEIYLHNGPEDYYYKRLRDRVKFVLIGCENAFDSCFCVDMGTNESKNYDASLELKNDLVYIDNKNNDWEELLSANSSSIEEVVPAHVTETITRVSIPENITLDIFNSKMWDEYDSRCINCGRCNFSCPTCTCFTMQDIFYTDNGKVGERRRVQASCMVDGFTDVAGGGSYRKKNGQRMRFKVMHKVYDFKKRNGYHMCTGCGRCDDVCPEYISYSKILNKLEDAMQEVSK